MIKEDLSMKYCVVGAGAMGGVYGLGLVAAGHSVTFFDVNEEHVSAINQHGYRLSGVTGDNTLPSKLPQIRMIWLTAAM